jgi:putative FmdB family regulatory protein
MPKYDTKCTECGSEKEIDKRMSEDYPPCSECGGELKTHFKTAPAFSLKGSGWACKDVKKKTGD